MREYYDRVAIVFLTDEGCYGTVEKLGAYASIVKWNKNDVDFEELLDNEDFIIVDEIVFEHVEED